MSKRTREAKKAAKAKVVGTEIVKVESKDVGTLTVTPPKPTPVVAPTKVIDTKTLPKDPDNKVEEIEGLLEELGDETDANEKKRIRRKLRSLGHWGGMRTKDTPVIDKATAHAKAPAATK